MISQIETKDLLLRKATLQDTESMLRNYWSQEEPCRYMLWQPTYNIDEAMKRMEKTIAFEQDKLAFVIEEKVSHEVIGMVGFLECEKGVYEDCGMGIGPRFVHRGYGTQVLQAFVECLFDECGADCIIYSSFVDNIASIKLQAKCGFVFSHTEDKVRQRDNLHYTQNVYKLSKENYINSKIYQKEGYDQR